MASGTALLRWAIGLVASVAAGCSCPPIPAVHGRVIDGWGEPVAGAALGNREGSEVVADANGSFTLREEPGRASGERCASRGQVFVHSDGCEGESVHTFSDGRDISLVCCPLATRFTFVGTIVDQNGAPLEGATVQQIDRGDPLAGAVAKSTSDGKVLVRYDGRKPGLRLTGVRSSGCEVKFQITRDGCTPLTRVVEKLPVDERQIELGVVKMSCTA